MIDALLDRERMSDVQAFFLVAMTTAVWAEVAIFLGVLLK
jgi:hypothetical protein